MNDQSIAWMIAGGRPNETPEEQRMRTHRRALAESTPSRADGWRLFRQRIVAAIGGRTAERTHGTALASDCCPA